MKKLIVLLAILLAGSASAQVSINAGTSMLVGFTSPGPWGGLHLGFEVPRNDAVSIFGKFTHYFRRRDPSVGMQVEVEDPSVPYPILVNVVGTPTMDYNVLEGGTRYYLGNGFDYGFAAYGGTSIKVIFNSVKIRYDEPHVSANNGDGSIFSLGFGLGGGVKYSTARFGTFYFDLDLAYMVFAQGSQTNIYTRMYNPLIFSFNLGWRKDIIW